MTRLEAYRAALSEAVRDGSNPELVKILTRECVALLDLETKRPHRSEARNVAVSGLYSVTD